VPDERPAWINTGRTPRRISNGLKTRLLIRANQRGRGTAAASLLWRRRQTTILARRGGIVVIAPACGYS
jgi:hypothetical protein